jgi:CheY-like chemotaxis protein
VKFCAGSRVAVRAFLEAPEAQQQRQQPGEQPPRQHWLTLRVCDGGRGMSEEELAACFHAYAAADPVEGGGHGLGLYISREFAQLMGGTLSCVSRLGEGAAFSLRVPLRVLPDDEAAAWAADAATAVAAAAADSCDDAAALAHAQDAAEAADAAPRLPAALPRRAPSLRCVFADDHPLNLKLVTRLLQANNFHVTAVSDGGAALEALKAAASPGGTPVDVAILDMLMPVMTGPQACAAYREWERERGLPRLPIVALSANAMEEHAQECAAVGRACATAPRNRARG